MKILFCASECFPFIKTGGLADVIYSLPKALKKEPNIERMAVIIPLYRKTKEKFQNLETIDEFYISLGYRHQYVGLKKTEMDGVEYYFIDNEQYFNRDAAYGYFDDGERFTFFSKAVVECMCRQLKGFDILHSHDWQAAMTIILAREYRLPIKTVMTIHNLRFQGIFPFTMVEDMLGLPYMYRQEDKLGYYNNANYLKGGIVFADRITTVSPTYLEEIKYPYYGEHLEGLIREKDYKMTGILNGIDYESFNPKTDKYLVKNYTEKTLKNKYINKTSFQKEMALPQNENIPMIGMVSRLTDQKGLDLINNVMHEILQMEVQVVILGTGDKIYEDAFRSFEFNYHDKMRAIIKYDDAMASKIYAACDIYLMPSQFEPCGLSQMIAMRYGSLPLVRETGGLKDSVKPYNKYTGEGTGFSFSNYNAHEMLFTLQKAIDLYYNNKEAFNNMIHQAMKQDFSWDNSCKKYIELYNQI